MRIPAQLVLSFFVLAVLAAGTGCESILGFKAFSERPSDEADGSMEGLVAPPGSDAAADTSISTDAADAASGDDSTADAGADAAGDSSDADLGPEIAPPPPPPAAGKAGQDITAGGHFSKTNMYTLIATVGEAPGGNVVSRTSMYTLKAGVVAATQ